MSGQSSDAPRGLRAAQDMLEAIADIDSMLAGRSSNDLRRERIIRRAFERCIPVISEASRRLPDDWKLEFGPQLQCMRIQDIGNVLRHGYDTVRLDVLWNVHEYDLDPLQLAPEPMIARHGP
jgi:uncharacterized protein with HEPN domain